MDEKINLSNLVPIISRTTGIPRRNVETFLKELFNCITSSLMDGDNIKLSGIGTFKAQKVSPRKSVSVTTGKNIEIPSHVKVVFTPDKSLAEAINEPFEMFEAVELADDVTEDILESEISNDNPDLITSPVTESSSDDSDIDSENDNEDIEEESDYTIEQTIITINESDEEPEEDNDEEQDVIVTVVHERTTDDEEALKSADNNDGNQILPPPLPEDTEETEAEPEETNIESSEDSEIEQPLPEKPFSKKARWGWFFTGFASAIVIGIVAIAIIYGLKHTDTPSKDTLSEIPENTEIAVADTVETDSIVNEAPETDIQPVTADNDKTIMADTKPSDMPEKKRYDTITRTRYLTTMSREYYGNYHFWPYIYEENKSILGHPDRIRPGTKVVIPDLAKYGVDPKNPKDLAEAKKKGVAIYARYK